MHNQVGWPYPIELPLPPSWNDGKRYLKAEELRQAAASAFAGIKLAPARYVMVLKFVCKWEYGNNQPLRKDVSNRVKQIEDAAMGALGLDDKWVWLSLAAKSHSLTTRPHVLISVFPVGSDGLSSALQYLPALL